MSPDGARDAAQGDTLAPDAGGDAVPVDGAAAPDGSSSDAQEDGSAEAAPPFDAGEADAVDAAATDTVSGPDAAAADVAPMDAPALDTAGPEPAPDAASDAGSDAATSDAATDAPRADASCVTCGASAVCVDFASDSNNCGGCLRRCASGQSCLSGVCQLPYACSGTEGSAWGPIATMAADLTGDGTRTLASVMAVFPNAGMQRTPGVTLAVRELDGTVHTAVYGTAFNSSFDPAAPALSASTLFQAGSISKPISATAYLFTDALDGTRGVDLRPAVASLVTPPYAITPNDLLTHTAGTSVHGYGGYLPGLRLPSVDQVVLGVSPANSLPVTFGTPGPWLYSGGGLMLWEAWLERVSGRDLPSYVRDRLFVPAHATRSNYAHPLPATEHDAACGLDPVMLPGVCRRNMPESAAAGLWTTPTDLVCMAGYAATRRADTLTLVQSRAVPIAGYPQRQGLGWRHRPANGVDETAGHFFEHSGTNYGFCSSLVFFSDGRSIAVMDNGCAGVAAVVVRALCGRLGWTCSGANFAAR